MHQKLIEINNYREDDSLNQSFLKACGANDLKVKKNDSETVATMCGSLTDVLCLTPELQNEFYYFSSLDKYPNPQLKDTLDKAFEISQEWDNTLLLEIFRSISKTKTNDDKVLENLKQNEDYWEELIISKDKKIITKDYYNICSNAAYTIKNHQFTKHHFENTLFADIQYQVPIYDEILFPIYGGVTHKVKRKGLLDMLIVDEAHKTIQFKDLKTTALLPTDWFKSARQFNYPFQCAWYYDIINKLFPDYRQLPPELIVYSFAAPTKPFTKILSNDDLFIGRNGCDIQKSVIIYERATQWENSVSEPVTERIMGWEECLIRYLISQENGWPDYDLDYWTNNGVVNKNIFG